MKKIYSYLALMIASASCFAQPTLTSSTVNPVIGQTVVKKFFTPVVHQEGNAGANQTWDWSTATEESSATGDVISPAGTAYAASYPTATSCFEDAGGSIEYDLGNSSGLYRLGIQSPNPPFSSIYDNSMQLLKYPFSYNGTYTDTYHSNIVGNGFPGTLAGTVTVTADGWGTLITPAGTFTNVLRVHAHMTETYDYGALGTTDQDFDQYSYFKSNVHYPLAEMVSGLSGGSPFSNASWSSSSVGIEEASAAFYKLSVYPNPASTNAEITYTLDKSSEVSIEITDVTGRVVQSFDAAETPPGMHTLPVTASPLSNGIYMVAATIDGRTASIKMVVSR